jgi:hypothetical protein
MMTKGCNSQNCRVVLPIDVSGVTSPGWQLGASPDGGSICEHCRSQGADARCTNFESEIVKGEVMTMEIPEHLDIPSGLDDVDTTFMTEMLRDRGVIAPTDQVVDQDERDVGMTAGYFSAIKKVKCTCRDAIDAPDSFVVKTWPPFEMLPRENIAAMFMKDVGGYSIPADRFFPRPNAHLAAFDAPNDRWVLLMDDADTFAEHKVHEREQAGQLDELGVDLWASDANIAIYKAVMPGGAKFYDRMTSMGESPLIAGRPWGSYVGGSDFAEVFTTRIDAFFERAHPERGATCTLAHGDLRGDNIFFCDDDRYPDGWLCVDFQIMFRGPVPSNLAYLMSTASVLPEVYSATTCRSSCERSTTNSWLRPPRIPATATGNSSTSTG